MEPQQGGSNRRAPACNFSCAFCGKGFIRETQCEEHMRRRHLGENPHFCPHCEAEFATKKKRDAHVAAMHPGEE
ncbi:unnamed protein product [Orchesella dallaii]|uniref:C2H2-type domain-containing protein n=1 Tax=Orchesella dallaii TaxID=48710 RepID=A0ABP1PX22_9HEXA